jgi:single-stranded-DNA-specific exonuclease
LITWHFPAEITIPTDLRAVVGGHPLVAEILARRGITDPAAARAFLDPSACTSSSPFDLPDMEVAVERLAKAISEGEPVCVWGDFDVDGQTATALLLSTLQGLGAEVAYHIPIRERESHGVGIPVLTEVIGAGARLILTCDTGISAHEAVQYAAERGVDVIVTDHHAPPEPLPNALALINPKLRLPGHPADSLPGVGVAFKLAEALYDRFGRAGEEARFLDLVALGIVADLALVKGDARCLLQRGLEALRRTERPGLQIMMELAELDPPGLTEEHIGFELGPRLNALGRLSDANPAVELLTTRDPARARVIATRLEGFNAQRRLLTSQVYQAARAQIDHDPSLLDGGALVLAHPAWPAGVIGIVASRLVEVYGRPAALIAAPPGELARGSARSLSGIDITGAIAACRGRLKSFGGHPMAAGFSLEAADIPFFRKELSAAVEGQLPETRIEPALEIDGQLDLRELTLELVGDLERLAPFGPGNPRPVMAARDLRLRSERRLGRNAEHRQIMVVDDEEGAYKVIWWGGGDEELPDWLLLDLPFDLAYTARASDFRGQRELQLEWVDARPLAGAAPELEKKRPPIHVEDRRRSEHPMAELERLHAEGELLIWAEGVVPSAARGKVVTSGRSSRNPSAARGDSLKLLAEQGIPAVDRGRLSPHRALAIWTTPPGSGELKAALEAVSPETVYLFANDPGMDNIEPFLQRLAGLVKYALRANAGRASLSSLAAAAAQRVSVVRQALAWLEAEGHIAITDEDGDDVRLEERGVRDRRKGNRELQDRGELDALAARLQALLAETAAFRAYYSRADVEALVGSGITDEQGTR